MIKRLLVMTALAALTMACFASVASAEPTIESVGEALFFDTDLSNPRGQACSSCHDPGAGFADPDSDLPVSQGAVPIRFGNRQAPSAAYASFIPERTFDAMLGTYVGGQFWDGRAPTLEEQAKGPFLNRLEMNMPNERAVVARVAQADYADDFEAVFGPQSLSVKNAEAAYDQIAEAIAAYERTEELNPFTSKHDYAESLTGPARMAVYTMAERQGMMLFNGAAQCNVCHVTPMSGMPGGGMGPGGGGGGMGPGGGGGMGPGGGGGMGPGAGPGPNMDDIVPTEPILFSDYRYANLGLPKNWDSPYLTLPPAFNPEGLAYIDHGLAADLPGGVEANPEFDGMFRTPSLRNVGLTAPYGHNGYFKTLKEIVHFYNTRDVPGAGWPEAEVPYNLETATMGNLGLTSAQEDQIVAFLLTLTDGWWTDGAEAPAAAVTADALGAGWAGGGGGFGGGGGGTGASGSTLTGIEKYWLTFMREEEKMARDVYLVLYDKWGAPIFSNIAASEQRHMDAVENLIEKYGITDPVEDEGVLGGFTDPDLAALYDALLARGLTSLTEAYQVGVDVETKDIGDLETAMRQTSRTDIDRVYGNLLDGSQNHLAAFLSMLD